MPSEAAAGHPTRAPDASNLNVHLQGHSGASGPSTRGDGLGDSSTASQNSQRWQRLYASSEQQSQPSAQSAFVLPKRDIERIVARGLSRGPPLSRRQNPPTHALSAEVPLAESPSRAGYSSRRQQEYGSAVSYLSQSPTFTRVTRHQSRSTERGPQSRSSSLSAAYDEPDVPVDAELENLASYRLLYETSLTLSYRLMYEYISHCIVFVAHS